jgi:hypothetical protein
MRNMRSSITGSILFNVFCNVIISLNTDDELNEGKRKKEKVRNHPQRQTDSEPLFTLRNACYKICGVTVTKFHLDTYPNLQAVQVSQFLKNAE